MSSLATRLRIAAPAFLFLLALGALAATPLNAGDLYIEDSANETYVESSNSSTQFATRFEPTATGLAEQLAILGRRTVTNTHMFSLSLHADGGTESAPAPGQLIASGFGMMPSGTQWAAVQIDPVELEAGEAYWVVFYTLNIGDTIQWYRSLNDSGESSRTLASTDGGQTWSNNSSIMQTLIVRSLPVTAVADSYNVLQGDSMDMPSPGVLLNDLYEGGGIMQAVLADGPEHGTVALNADGSFNYIPNPAFSGTDSFSYKAVVGSSESEPVAVTFNVEAVNQPPRAGEVTYAILEGEELLVNAPGVLAYASDPESDPLQAILVSATDNGNLVLNADGSFAYTPVDSFLGKDRFIYRVNDGELDSEEAIVTLEVHRKIVLPVAEDRAFEMLEDGTLAVKAADGLLRNGTDIDLVVMEITEAPAHGTLQVEGDGAFAYAPNADFNGADQFTYSVTDSHGEETSGTVVIEVLAVNDAPTYNLGANIVVNENAGSVNIKHFASEVAAGPANEADQAVAFELEVIEGAELFDSLPQIEADGHMSFVVAPAVWGTATFLITLIDNGGTENGGVDAAETQTFEITVNPEAAAPSFVAGGDVLAMEDAGQVLAQGWASEISFGGHSSADSLVFIATVQFGAKIFAELPTIDAETGNLSFRTAEDANGYADISVVLMEEGGDALQSPHQSFRITILAVNDAPSFVAGAHIYAEAADGATEVEAWATQISAGPANESDQQLAFNVEITEGEALFEVAPAIDAQGTLTFVPAQGAKGTALMQVTLLDDGGAENGGVDGSETVLLQIELNSNPAAMSGGSARGTSAADFSGCAGAGTSPWMPAIALLAMLAGVGIARRRTA